MINEQKLLQWVEDKLDMYAPSASDTKQESAEYKGCRKVLYVLEMAVRSGDFEQEEDEQNENEANRVHENQSTSI